jgi:tetratricopeptide (TPR) repeat protein
VAAQRTADLRRKVTLLEDAVARNPASWRAHFELGAIFRREGRYGEAEQALKIAVQLKQDFAPAWRELGIILGKAEVSHSEAIEAFDRALALDDQDAETGATQGGLLRRLSRKSSPGHFDTTLLERALVCYRRASQIAPNQLYSLMNAARIELLLAGLRREDTKSALARFRDLEHLARYAVSSGHGSDSWEPASPTFVTGSFIATTVVTRVLPMPGSIQKSLIPRFLLDRQRGRPATA